LRKLLFSIVAAAAVLAGSAAGAAEQKGPARQSAVHRESLATSLGLRLHSIEIQIDILSDRGMIGREEARELRQQSRRLEQRLYGLNGREGHEVELAVDRLQASLRSAANVAFLDLNASGRRDLGRFDDGDRYQRDRGSYADRDSYRPPDPRGDPFAIWDARDCREGIC
jgi:hypothetical protein